MFFSSKKRGQAALEFLMTYAWAILVVIIIIGALAYFGVLNPDALVPSKCTLTTGLACTDYIYLVNPSTGSGNVTLVITNGLGRPINVSSLNFTGTNIGTCGADFRGFDPGTVNGIVIENGGRAQLSVQAVGCYTTLTSKQRLISQITYRFIDGTLDHMVEGELFTNPQEV